MHGSGNVDLMNQYVPLGIDLMDRFRPYLGSIRIVLTSSLRKSIPDQRPSKSNVYYYLSDSTYLIRIPAFRLEAQPY